MRRTLLSVDVPPGIRLAKENRPAIFRTRRERRRALNLTLYVYFCAFPLISCIFSCYFLHNCSIFYVLQGVNSLAGVNRV